MLCKTPGGKITTTCKNILLKTMFHKAIKTSWPDSRFGRAGLKGQLSNLTVQLQDAPGVVTRRSAVVGRKNLINITRRVFKGRLVKINAVAPKENKTKNETKKQRKQTTNKTMHTTVRRAEEHYCNKRTAWSNKKNDEDRRISTYWPKEKY